MRINYLIQPDSTVESNTYRNALERAVEETEREFANMQHVELDEDVRELPLPQTGMSHQ